ncbi:argininosuccinate lyase [Candidatus Micrarchaeota archaeon]|nr:argininosuccinate lyase [Candidatus Micrarchaeota archaeon]
MSKMLWGGRFSKEPSRHVLEYNSRENLALDEQLVPYDVEGSKAHVVMLGECKIMEKEEVAGVLRALVEAEKLWREGKFELKLENEDVHLNVEKFVLAKAGSGAAKMHTARSRNDQVSVDLRMFLRDALNETAEKTIALVNVLVETAGENAEVIMPGYTHTRVAQPVTVGFWLSAHAASLLREVEKLEQAHARANTSPLGACALAGTSWKIDRKLTAELLGFDTVQENALDAIDSRNEFEVEAIGLLASLSAKLGKIAGEIVLFSGSEFGFVELGDEHATGSSIMPQKKNPDCLEIMRARANRIAGNFVAALAIQKETISGYNSDFQETKPMLFESLEIVGSSLELLPEVVKAMKFNEGRMIEVCEENFACATELADLVARKGIPFRKAHEVAGSIVRECVEKKKKLGEVSVKQVKEKTKAVAGVEINVGEGELASALDVSKSVQAHENGPNSNNVKKIIAGLKKQAGEKGKNLEARIEKIGKAKEKLERRVEALL